MRPKARGQNRPASQSCRVNFRAISQNASLSAGVLFSSECVACLLRWRALQWRPWKPISLYDAKPCGSRACPR